MPGSKTVVVVNDDRTMLGLIGEILLEEQYRVVTCDNVHRAHDTIKETMPDLAIVDVRIRSGGSPAGRTPPALTCRLGRETRNDGSVMTLRRQNGIVEC